MTELATANAAAAAAQAAADAAQAVMPINPALMAQGDLGLGRALIPKPKGSAGNGYCLQKEMGLQNKKPLYNRLVVRASILHMHVSDDGGSKEGGWSPATALNPNMH